MTNYLSGQANRPKIIIYRLINTLFYASCLISFIFLIYAGVKISKADEEQESTVSLTVGIPQPTGTATPGPTASPGATATPSPFPSLIPAILDTTDYSTNTNDLTNNSGVAPSGDTPFEESSISADFDGSNYLSIPDANQTDLDGFTQFTFEFWVNFTALPTSGNTSTIISKDTSGTGNKSYNVGLFNDSGTYKLLTQFFETDIDYTQVSYDWTPETQIWYHVAISCDLSKEESKCSFYINGFPVGSGDEDEEGNGAKLVQDSGSPFRLGRGAWGNYFLGFLDDVRIWNDIRTAEEIAANDNRELGGTEHSLVAYWPFESVIPSPAPAGIFKIFGYAPTKSRVFLNGIAVSENTFTRTDGYFEFTRLFFPTILSYLSGFRYPELCLFAQDDVKRVTSPVCIPALPLEADTIEVGPILLSPTLEIEKGSLAKGEQAKAAGKTVPNAEVDIYLAREKSGFSWLAVIKEVLAYTIPIYQIKSNTKGNFEFNLPNDSDTWRLFAGAKVLGSQSAKSNTLTFNVRSPALSFLITILELIKKFYLLLKPYWFYLLILIQIVIIILLIRHLAKKHQAGKKGVHPKHKTRSYTTIVSEYKKILEKRLPNKN